ncbi:HesA/MoeB/ThiF family protein [Candidatus Bathyarchaeota archaeon]|nr:HesA/MoeB/ThiF family protein [Candidatus Bathyarchaeota archaeon]
MNVKLTEDELTRYSRQIMIPNWNVEGQIKLKNAKVTIVGVGGLGCPVALYLTAAGIGRITLIDKEKIELSNLNRQILHWSVDIGKFKTFSAIEKLSKLNPLIKFESYEEEIERESIRELIKGSNVAVDCLDNWKTRFILNEACVSERIPLVHAGVHSWYGQITTIMPGKGPCLRCILPKTPKEEEKFPVLGVTAGVLGLLEALEAIKIIVGLGKPLVGRILFFDGETLSFQEAQVQRKRDCPVCGGIR